MAVDKGYGSGYNNTGMPKYTPTKVTSGQQGFHISDTKNEWSLNFGGLKILGVDRRPIPQQQAEMAPAPQTGQLAKMLTGVGYDENGKFGVDPVGLAMAWTPIKISKFVNISKKLRLLDPRPEFQTFAEMTSKMIGQTRVFGGKVTRNLDQGSQVVYRSGETAANAVIDRAAAGELGREISRIMAKGGLRSRPNTFTQEYGRAREVFTSVADSTPATIAAQKIARYRDPGSLYPGGVPAGGYIKSPNLRAVTPIVSAMYSRISPRKTLIENGLSIAQQDTARKVAELLEEATVRRRLSAGMQTGGEYYFPRTYQPYNFSRTGVAGRLDPATYQAEVMDFIRGKVRDRRFIK